MGACNFIEFQAAKTAKEAFDILVMDAVEWYGNNPYNGTISTTSLSRRAPKNVGQKTYGPRAMKKAIKMAEDDGFGQKWEARVIDCGKTKGGHMWAFYGWASC